MNNLIRTVLADQKGLHSPIHKWLESKEVRVCPESEKVPVQVRDIFPPKNFIFPDVIGIRSNLDVFVVETETDPEKIFEVMGKCMLWKTLATYVYIAYPKEECEKLKVLERFGIGLLGVSGDHVDEIIPLPTDGSNILKVVELHPLDYQRQADLYRQAKRLIEAS